jgi:hypothetical protein
MQAVQETRKGQEEWKALPWNLQKELALLTP